MDAELAPGSRDDKLLVKILGADASHDARQRLYDGYVRLYPEPEIRTERLRQIVSCGRTRRGVTPFDMAMKEAGIALIGVLPC